MPTHSTGPSRLSLLSGSICLTVCVCLSDRLPLALYLCLSFSLPLSVSECQCVCLAVSVSVCILSCRSGCLCVFHLFLYQIPVCESCTPLHIHSLKKPGYI